MRIFFPDTPDILLPPGHRFPAHKYRLLRQAVLDRHILSADEMSPAPLASVVDLCRAHDPRYVESMLAGNVTADMQRLIGLPWSHALVERSRLTVGGTLAAARQALITGVSGLLAGGTHHAHRAHGAGFCVFNDCAVTALTLLDEGAVARIAVLDLDVHQGDGNAAILTGHGTVFVASVHGENNYPFAKFASSLDIALPDGAEDDTYLAACERALDAVLRFSPELVLYIAGADPLASDRLGRLAVTHGGLMARDAMVLSACRNAGVPVAILMGGGYAEPIDATVHAYANTFQVARDVFTAPIGQQPGNPLAG